MKHRYEMEKIENACVAIGDFQFIHKGHQELIRILVEEAKKSNCKAVIVSLFDSQEETYTTEEEKAYFLEQLGVDEMISFEKKAGTDYEVLLEEIFSLETGIQTIVIGKDEHYHLIHTLACSKNVNVIGCDLVKDKDEVITKEQIQAAFDAHEFEKVEELCGHPYFMMGIVEHGKALGRTVGMPTVNLGVGKNKKRPPSGVYGTRTHVKNEVFMGVTNVGKRPTVDKEKKITIETFLLDFSQDVYGERIVMEIKFFIRGVIKFDHLEQVQNQVQLDAKKTRRFFIDGLAERDKE